MTYVRFSRTCKRSAMQNSDESGMLFTEPKVRRIREYQKY